MNLKNVCLSILIILGFIFAFIMKKSLSQDQINILNHKGTEPAFSGDLLYNKEKGTYLCVGCDNVLFSSEKKFDSGSGWPSFSETNNIKSIVKALKSGQIEIKNDKDGNVGSSVGICGKIRGCFKSS